MDVKPLSPDEYIAGLPDERRLAVERLRKVINDNIPAGFEEKMCHGMIGWVVPKESYPPGYHCDPDKPLMLMSLASQKNYISLHHMGLYSGTLLNWFESEWKSVSSKKLDMGKACVRFKKTDDIPYDLVGRLSGKLTPGAWIEAYEKALRRRPG